MHMQVDLGKVANQSIFPRDEQCSHVSYKKTACHAYSKITLPLLPRIKAQHHGLLGYLFQ